MKSPCFDVKNNKDCPDRCIGCSTICALWHQYVQERDKEYDRRQKESKALSDYFAHHTDLHKRTKKYRGKKG